MTSKTMQREKMAANMRMIDQLNEDMEDQVEVVPEVGTVTINTHTDQLYAWRKGKVGSSRSQVRRISLKTGSLLKKMPGFVQPNKISTCMVWFKAELGLRCFYPEPQKGGNSNTGNLAKSVSKNPKV